MLDWVLAAQIVRLNYSESLAKRESGCCAPTVKVVYTRRRNLSMMKHLGHREDPDASRCRFRLRTGKITHKYKEKTPVEHLPRTRSDKHSLYIVICHDGLNSSAMPLKELGSMPRRDMRGNITGTILLNTSCLLVLGVPSYKIPVWFPSYCSTPSVPAGNLLAKH